MPFPARTALVTGGNRGIGLEVCRRLGQAGYRVLLAARDPALGEEAARTLCSEGLDVQAVPLDVASPESVAALAGRLEGERVRLDALVNNAGIYQGPARQVLAVNFFGARQVTERLLPLLADGARVVMVTSGLGSLDGLPPALRERLDPPRSEEDLVRAMEETAARGGPAYGVSKAGLNALARLLAPALAPRGILVNAVSPGWARTRMGGPGAPRSVEEGADGVAWAAMLPADGPTGVVLQDRQVVGF